MSNMVAWIAAEAEVPRIEAIDLFGRGDGEDESTEGRLEHEVAAKDEDDEANGELPQFSQEDEEAGQTEQQAYDTDRERRIYRARTVAMLRRYMQYSIETGRLPSLLGREFFRAKVTSYTVVTFEDRVIFVHDMETCLSRLDDFSRQLIARHILQEHDRWATARLLHCNEKTIRRYTPIVLDLLSDILIEVGLLKRVDATRGNSCQGGKNGPFSANDCEDGKYKF
jgi:hypothetical protein